MITFTRACDMHIVLNVKLEYIKQTAGLMPMSGKWFASCVW